MFLPVLGGGLGALQVLRERKKSVEVGERGRTRLRAPRWLRKLTLGGYIENVEIELHQRSFPFRIVIHAQEIPLWPPTG